VCPGCREVREWRCVGCSKRGCRTPKCWYAVDGLRRGICDNCTYRSSRSEQTSTARIESVPLREALRSRCQGRTCPLSSTGQKLLGRAWLAVTASGVTDSGVRVLLCRWAARGFEGIDRLVDRDGEPKVAMLRARVRPTR
jgi:hypothetical protein